MEQLLEIRYKEKYEFYSAGISPIISSMMDKRSRKFLIENDCKPKIHTPKKITKKMLNYFDYFIAIDLFVLSNLNLKYPKFRKKFILSTSQFKNLDIIDPYSFEDNEYKQVMNTIKKVSENIDLDVYAKT